MRRQDKEIKDTAEIDDIIRRAEVCHIGFADGGEPYIVPVNFGYRDGQIFFHCARTGRKLEIIRRNNRVCFEIDIDHEMAINDMACEWGFRYKSVMGTGRAFIIDDYDEKCRALDVIMTHYTEKYFTYREDGVADIYIVRIDIESLSAKQAV